MRLPTTAPRRRSAASSRRSERGAAAIELALLLPLLVVIVFGIVEFSIAFNRQQGLHAAAREGARLASLPQSTTGEIRTRVDESLQGVLPAGHARTITVSPSGSRPCQGRSGETVTVTVRTDNDVVVPVWDSFTVTLTGRGEFRCE
ncbi:MAG: pilus assembly protein [Acidimicrobiia bacterium]|nr:pilus assembly protein [Acidimicrobiia bacterium]